MNVYTHMRYVHTTYIHRFVYHTPEYVPSVKFYDCLHMKYVHTTYIYRFVYHIPGTMYQVCIMYIYVQYVRSNKQNLIPSTMRFGNDKNEN